MIEEVDLKICRPDTHDRALVKLPPSLQNWEITVSECPWCSITPFLDLPLDCGTTWVWSIRCENIHCPFKPQGRGVSIRKSQRFDLSTIKRKLDRLVFYWNSFDINKKSCVKIFVHIEKLIKWIEKNSTVSSLRN